MKVTDKDILTLIEEALAEHIGRPLGVGKLHEEPATPAAEEKPSGGTEEWLGQFMNWANANPRRRRKVQKNLRDAGVSGGLRGDPKEVLGAAFEIYGERSGIPDFTARTERNPEWDYSGRQQDTEAPEGSRAERWGGAPPPRDIMGGMLGLFGAKPKPPGQRKRKKKDGAPTEQPTQPPAQPATPAQAPTPAQPPAEPVRRAVDFDALMNKIDTLTPADYKRLGDGNAKIGHKRVRDALASAKEQALADSDADMVTKIRDQTGEAERYMSDAAAAIETSPEESVEAAEKVEVPEVPEDAPDSKEIKEQLGRWKTLAGIP